MTHWLPLMLPAALLLFTLGCGGAPPPPDPAAETTGAAAPAPLGPQDPLGPLICPAGATVRAPEADATNPGHEASWCASDTRKNGPYRLDLRAEDGSTVRLAEGNYVDDQRDGRWSFYRQDGSKHARGAFRRGRPTGAWSWWYENGNQRLLGDYMDGLRTGTWSYWNEDGTRLAEGIFVNGDRDGEWRYLNAEGATTRTERWQRGKLVSHTGDEVVVALYEPDFTTDAAP